MMILPIQDQLIIQEVTEYIIAEKRKQTSIAEIMKKYHLNRTEYNMIENLALPAYTLSNELEAYKAKHNILKARIANAKAEWAKQVLREENEGGGIK